MEANESYDEKLFIQPQSDHLKCPICFNIMRDPVQCPTQGHTFCRCCVSQHLDRMETCPTCRDPLKKKKLIPNRGLCSMIEDAEVHCFTFEPLEENRVKGRKKIKRKIGEFCDWSGKLSEAEGHYKECQFAKVNCPHIGCDDIFLRSSLLEHTDSCCHRLVPCQWCNVRKKIDLLDAHLLICRKRPVPCPNSCLDVNGAVLCFNPSEIKQHRTVCSMESLLCKYAGVGCKINLMRKDMPLHENDTGAHIPCFFEAVQIAQENISDLSKDLENSRIRILDLERESNKMKTLIGDTKYTQLIVKVPVSKLVKGIESVKINVSGHTFSLHFQKRGDAEMYSLYLRLLKDDLNVGPVHVEAIFEIVSHTALRLTHKTTFNYTYLVASSRGYTNFIETAQLKDAAFVKDGCITLRAKIFVKP